MSHGEVRQVNGKRVASPEYRSWQMMKNRCLNPGCKDYRRYRHLPVWRDWLSFDAFLQDMGRKPTPAHTLERRDNERGYFPANCYWATRQEQARNRGDYIKLSLKAAANIRRLYATGNWYQYEIAKRYGITQSSVSQIIRNASWKGDA